MKKILSAILIIVFVTPAIRSAAQKTPNLFTKRPYWYSLVSTGNGCYRIDSIRARTQPAGYITPKPAKPIGTEMCNGIDDNCNGTADEVLTQYIYYLDSNGDGYGEATTAFIQTCEDLVPLGYSQWIIPVADLTLTDSKVPVNIAMATGNFVDLPRKGALNAQDVTLDPIYSLAKSLNNRVLSAWNGQEAGIDVPPALGDTLLNSQRGYGAKPGTDPNEEKCHCTIPYTNTRTGQQVSFWVSFIKMVRRFHTPVIISANVETGTWGQLKNKIESTLPYGLLMIRGGDESNLKESKFGGDPAKYLAVWNPWCDSIHKLYPGVLCIDDYAPVEAITIIAMGWNQYLFNNSHSDGGDTYFQLDDCTSSLFTGDMKKDTALMYGSQEVVQERLDLFTARFPGKDIVISQKDLADAFVSTAGQLVYDDTYFASEFVTLSDEVEWNYNATHDGVIIADCYQTIKNQTGGDSLHISAKMWTLRNNLMKDSATYLQPLSFNGLHLYGVKSSTGTYKLIIANETGLVKQLPKSVSLDGYYMSITLTGTGYSANSLLSKFVASVNIVGALPPFTTAYFEIKKPN